MSQLYPNLCEKFKNEKRCPVCLSGMADTIRYTCQNNHELCLRCKPYYFSCPTCRSVLTEIPRNSCTDLQPGAYPTAPSAPSYNEFYADDRLHGNRMPMPVPAVPMPMPMPMPTEHEAIYPCPYASYGCWVKFPERLRNIHVPRCQFRQDLEDGKVSTDLSYDQEDYVSCRYRDSGCSVRTTYFRIKMHENLCIYKDVRAHGCDLGNASIEDSSGLVDCRYRDYGCRVRMPIRKKYDHECNCNYKDCQRPVYSDNQGPPDRTRYDPDELVSCRYASSGCRVRPRFAVREKHEMNCNYKSDGNPYNYRYETTYLS